MNPTWAAHPSHELLTAFVRGQLDDATCAEVEAHLLHCENCVSYLRTISEDDIHLRIRSADTSTFEPASATRVLPENGSSDEELQRESQPGFRELSEEVLTALADHPRYKIGPQLGAGGMGVVYRAEHRLMERPVAIKVIAPRLVSHGTTIERFRQEVKLDQQTGDVLQQPLENGRRYRMLLRVRRNSVEAYLNDALAARYRGDDSNLNLLEMWNLQNANALGIGAYQARATFHSVRIRPMNTSF